MNRRKIHILADDQAKEERTINGEVWEGHPEALDALQKQFERQASRKASMQPEVITAALQRVAMCLREHDTDSTAQLKRFVWSLWNGHHIVNLYNLGRVLDDDNSDAVATIFTAYMRGLLSEDNIRDVLKYSNEMERFDAAERRTPDRCPTNYPPIPQRLREFCRELDNHKAP